MQIVKNPDGSWGWSSAPVLASPGSSAYFKMKQQDPGMLSQMEQQRDEARGASQNATPKADPNAGERPAGVSQYVWDRATSGTLTGLNVTAITNNPETRQALIDAGYGDYVKAAYEKGMDQRAAHYGQNGASDPWANAQYDWYTQQYGDYRNDTVQSTEATLGFGHTSPNPTNPGYTPPTVVQPPPAGGQEGGGTENGGGSSSGDTGGGMTDAERAARIAAANAKAAEMAQSGYTKRHTGGGSMMEGYRQARGPQNGSVVPETVANPNVDLLPLPSAPQGDVFPTQSAAPRSTPFADAYLRAKGAAEAPGPVSGMMKKWME